MLNVVSWQPKALHVDTRRFGDGGGERVAVLHELLELGLADDLAELAEQDLGDVLLHTLLGLVEVVAGRVLQRLGLTAVLIDDDGLRGDLEVGDGVHVDEDGVLRRDRRVRLEQGLHRTKRQPVDAHDERYDERGAAGDEPAAAGTGDDHDPVGRADLVARRGEQDDDDGRRDDGDGQCHR